MSLLAWVPNGGLVHTLDSGQEVVPAYSIPLNRLLVEVFAQSLRSLHEAEKSQVLVSLVYPTRDTPVVRPVACLRTARDLIPTRALRALQRIT